jgi:ribosomal-protein-alanine N-acetyltransferase
MREVYNLARTTMLDDKQPIEIVQASLLDINSVRELERLSFTLDAWPLIEMIGVLSMPAVERWKAMDGDKMVGFVAADVRRKMKLAWIATISVHPDYRGRGIAAQLMDIVESRVGMPRMRLTVRGSNLAARRLYDRRGYEQIDVWPKYYVGGEDAIVMEKDLE